MDVYIKRKDSENILHAGNCRMKQRKRQIIFNVLGNTVWFLNCLILPQQSISNSYFKNLIMVDFFVLLVTFSNKIAEA